MKNYMYSNSYLPYELDITVGIKDTFYIEVSKLYTI
jgi:hypothetical protein